MICVWWFDYVCYCGCWFWVGGICLFVLCVLLVLIVGFHDEFAAVRPSSCDWVCDGFVDFVWFRCA